MMVFGESVKWLEKWILCLVLLCFYVWCFGWSGWVGLLLVIIVLIGELIVVLLM